MVKASEFKNVCKAVNDRQLESLKKEIIEILKKQDEKELKKAINLFESQEMHYTHLEKSLISGKWIQKAGYGVGTVRIWKGKKYKKIAPGKWARVFDKEGRGTNIAIGKLIAKVQKIDNVEDLMAFVMQNKQRFVDENGIDLPVLDKLRAAVDAKNNGGMRSKLPDPKDDNSVAEYKKQIKDKVKEYNMNYEKYLENQIAGAERHNVTENELKALKELQVELKETSKPAEKENLVRLKHIVSPIEFTDNHGNKIRYEIDEVKDAPEDYQNPVRVYKVEGNVRTEIAGNVKNYEDAYSAVMEQVEKTKEGTTETEKKYIDESIKTLPKEDSKGNKIEESEAEKTKNEESNSEDIKRAKEKIKQYAGKKINSNEISDIKILDDGERSGFLTFEFKSGNDKYKMTYDSGFGGEKGGVSIKKIESEESENKEEKKVIENNPKSIEGMEFVNKNKMHVLANFLANHDNVNMATAVIRLQAAYEKLGEEKFLAHFPKDVVERYRKEAGKEEPKKESFTPISKDKMKSMSDDELKEYEAKLEKDLLNSNRNDSDYMDKYNHWREVHGENNDRFHQAIEDEARAEKQAEADAKSAKEKEINEKYNGYFENRKGLDKARDLKTLEKKYNFDGKVMSSKEFVEQAMDNGAEIKEREVNKLDYPSKTRWNRMNGYEQEQYERRIKEAGKKTIYSIDGYEFPKTVVDYAKFYKEKNGNVKKSLFDDFVMDMFIDEDEEIEDAIKTDESLFNDYSAEQPELFNSTEMKVQEAFNRCGCCL